MVGNDVSAPRLAPVIFTPPASGTCGPKFGGKVQLSLVVDANGHPRNIMFEKPLANVLDRLALAVVEVDRFAPAMRDSAPVAVGQDVEVNLKSCVVQQIDSAGQKRLSLRLRAVPEQRFKNDSSLRGQTRFAPEDGSPDRPGEGAEKVSKVGGSVCAPILLLAPEAQYTDLARRSGVSGTCLIQLIVDQHGMPKNLRVIKPVGYGLDQAALSAVSLYRFKPGLWNGKPVPITITVQVNFKIER
ncbi:MAG TPA: energy transducer TonB [Terracidiphilus sp.]|nr:energy transducer TonB [Terracidiphilus sp.]